MSGTLDAFTRKLEECRRRWNRHSLEFVLESAKVLRAAREAAQDGKRWMKWLRWDAHMNRGTAFRHLRVAEFLESDVALKQHCATLSISKVYALSRTRPIVAHRLLADDRVRSMTDVEFARFIRHYLPRAKRRPTAPNLLRAIMSGLEKAGRGIARWKGTRHAIPGEYRARIEARLRELLAAASHLRRTRRKAL